MDMLKAAGFSLLVVTSFTAWGASPFFYPRTPDVSHFAVPPAWLLNAKGDDGYVMVTAETDLPRDKGCIPLGDAGWLKTFFKKEIQLSTSVVVDGFDMPQSGRESMLLTLDGRNNAGGCVLASTARQLIVPLTPTKKIGPGDAGDLKFTVLVRSTTDSKANLVAPAQSMLAVAAVFATGGTAATVAGLSTTLTKPAFDRAEKFIDLQFGNTLPSQKTASLTWKDHIYAGVQTIQVPVYLGETKSGQTVLQASEALQKTTPEEAKKAFTVRLQFRYYKSVFDPTLPTESAVPSIDSVGSAEVLAYPNRPEQMSLLQTLMSGGAESNLLQRLGASSGGELAEACSDVLKILSRSGLNKLDRAITLKAFLDVANKGTGWYGNAKYESCFTGRQDIRQIIRQVYGDEPSIEFVSLESQSLPGVAAVAQKNWEESIPILSRIQRALSAEIGREELMMTIAANGDIALGVSSAGWPAPVAAVAGANAATPSTATFPGIQRLVAKRVKSAGCFMAGADPARENAMLLLDEQDEVWLARFGYGVGEARKIQSVELSKLASMPEWRNHVATLKGRSLFPEGGECSSKILPKAL